MIKPILQGAATLALLMLATTLYFVPFWVKAWTAEIDSASAAVNSVALATILSEKSIALSVENGQRGLNANLNLITDPEEGHLAIFNHSLQLGLLGTLKNLNYLNSTVSDVGTSVQAAIYGTTDRDGFLDVTSNVAHVTGQFSESYPKLESRFMAVSGESMKTLDAWRRASNTIDQHLPRLIDSWERISEEGAGIAGDTHAFTSKFIAPRPLRAKIWDGAKLAVYGAARAF